MDENIFRSISGRDEAEPLVTVEEFHGTLHRHDVGEYSGLKSEGILL